jgi:hypothetical protein
MPDALSAAKNALAHATKTFPSSPLASPAKPVVAATKPISGLGAELTAKKTMVDKAQSALPALHGGGPVPADGAYNLKAGEHVLTATEAAKARKHAIMAAGIKSLTKSGKTNSKKRA